MERRITITDLSGAVFDKPYLVKTEYHTATTPLHVWTSYDSGKRFRTLEEAEQYKRRLENNEDN